MSSFAKPWISHDNLRRTTRRPEIQRDAKADAEDAADAATVREVLVRNVDRSSTLYTDSSRLFTKTDEEYAKHRTTNHAKGEYARREGDVVVHSNTIESVFSVFKRGMVGVYQHCGEAHLHRYLAEFDFRYNRRTALKVTDTERAIDAIRGAAGKRLTYLQTDEAHYA